MANKRLRLVLTLGASMSLLACGNSGADAARAGRQPAPQTAEPELRTTQPLMEGWRFVLDDDMSDEEALDADAADWAPVTLPHTWNAEDAASLQAEDFERGTGWYRLEFPTPADGERHWLEFGAASIVAEVWLNGERLGEHRGGFTQFRFDVTDALAEGGGTNVLLVKTNNDSGNSPDDPTAIDPIGGDFNESGGLYRHVALISTPAAAHIALNDFGGPGVYAATTALEGTNATVDVRTRLQSAGDEAEYTVRVSLLDADGAVAATADQAVTVPADGDAEVTHRLNVQNAHLWNGLDDPYLYRLVAELVDGSGAPVDRVTERFGIRTIRFDPNEGILLNGQHVRANGVAIHQDFLHKAWATTQEEWDLSFSVIREMGANFVRLGHYTFPKMARDKADELGLMTWAEKASGLRTTTDRCTEDEPTEEYLENARQQLREHIRQQYNHPSIAVWSVGNETEAGQIFCSPAVPDNVTPYLRMLHDLAKEEDPHRHTANAEFTYGNDVGANPFTTAGITDVLGTNRYYAWYSLELEEFSPRLDALHEEFPDQSIGVSEYGAGAALTHHTDNVLGGPPEVRSAPEGELAYQPEEYQAYVHVQNYRVIVSKPYLWGSTLWNLFDFGSAHRNEGDVIGVNTKGLVTFDRQTRKDAFYFYQANWSEEPVTWIVGKRYTDRAYSAYDVRVFSNADSVELRVNDTPVGALTADQCDLRECVFEDVTLQPGVNRVTAVGNHGGTQVTDEVEWTWNRTDVNIAAGRLATGYEASTGTRWGSDHFFDGGRGEFYAGAGVHPLAGGLEDASGGVPDDIANTPDPLLYKYLRTGDFSYDIPLADGTYEVTLGFIEPDESAARGERVFDVTANGETLLDDFDVLREAGGHRTVVTRTFTVNVTGGRLVLDFAPREADANEDEDAAPGAIVSTIKIQPAGAAQ